MSSRPPTKTNTDIVELIAQYVDPDPVVFSRLASVNRDFYHVFTSDKVWAGLDVYQKRQHIYSDFLSRLAPFAGLMRACWWGQSAYRFDIQSVDNLYAQLGYFVHANCFHNLALPAQLVRLLMRSYGTLSEFPRFVPDREMALYACKHSGLNLILLPPHLVEEEEFYRELIDAAGPRDAEYLAPSMRLMITGREHALVSYALKTNPRCLASGPLYQDMIEPYILNIRAVVASGPPLDRASVLEIVRGNPMLLDVFPDYYHDREMCLAAFKRKSGTPFAHDLAPLVFLAECEDRAVVAAALDTHPNALNAVNPKFVSPAALVRAIEIDANILAFHATGPAELFSNQAVLTAFVDHGWLVKCRRRNILFKGEVALHDLLNDLQWSKERVEKNPGLVHYFDVRLNTQVVESALKAQTILNTAPEGLITPYTRLKRHHLTPALLKLISFGPAPGDEEDLAEVAEYHLLRFACSEHIKQAAMELVAKDGRYFWYLPLPLQHDRDIQRSIGRIDTASSSKPSSWSSLAQVSEDEDSSEDEHSSEEYTSGEDEGEGEEEMEY